MMAALKECAALAARPSLRMEDEMGFFDDAANSAVPGGGLAKPLMIAAAALLAAKMFSKSDAPKSQPAPAPQPADVDGGLLGGLGGLIDQFRKGGQGDVIDSWVGSGQNKPIQPPQLEQTLGRSTIGDLARRSGLSEQELLAQLSAVLPDLVDKLTPQGRLPTEQEIRAGYRR